MCDLGFATDTVPDWHLSKFWNYRNCWISSDTVVVHMWVLSCQPGQTIPEHANRQLVLYVLHHTLKIKSFWLPSKLQCQQVNQNNGKSIHLLLPFCCLSTRARPTVRGLSTTHIKSLFAIYSMYQIWSFKFSGEQKKNDSKMNTPDFKLQRYIE